MKKFASLLFAGIVLASWPAGAQNYSREVKAESKRLEKDGWMALPGAPSISSQLTRSYKMTEETTIGGQLRFQCGTDVAVGTTLSAALFEATEMAKLNLATKLQSEIAAQTSEMLTSRTLSQAETKSLLEFYELGQTLIATSLIGCMEVIQMYRCLPGGNYEVSIRLACETERTLEAARRYLKEQLELNSYSLEASFSNYFTQL